MEKLVLSKLYEEGSNKRIFNIDRHVGMVTTHTRSSTFATSSNFLEKRCLPPSVHVVW